MKYKERCSFTLDVTANASKDGPHFHVPGSSVFKHDACLHQKTRVLLVTKDSPTFT